MLELDRRQNRNKLYYYLTVFLREMERNFFADDDIEVYLIYLPIRIK